MSNPVPDNAKLYVSDLSFLFPKSVKVFRYHGVADLLSDARLRSSSCQIHPISYLTPVTQSLLNASVENLHLLLQHYNFLKKFPFFSL